MGANKDLTRGGVVKTLFLFSLPMVLSRLLQTLYGIVDLFIVGRFSDAVQIAGVSEGSLILNTVNFSIVSFTVGGTVLIGQYMGARQQKQATETIGTMMTLYPLVGLGLSVLLIALSAPLLRLIRVPEESFAATLAYIRICFAGLFFTAAYNGLASVLRGLGDSRTPLIFVAVACVFNVAGDLLLVKGLHMGAAGAAVATTGSQALSVVIGVVWLRRRGLVFDFKPASFRMKREKVRLLVRLGLPLGVQDLLVMSSFVATNVIVNSIGYIAVAASGVADKVYSIAMTLSDGFSNGVAAMVAQNVGAGDYRRAKSSMWWGVAFSLGVSLVFFVIMLLSPQTAPGVFTNDAQVVAVSVEYMTWFKYEFVFCSIIFTMNAFFNGTGHTRYTLCNNLIATLGVRLPGAFIITGLLGRSMLVMGAVIPASSLVQVLICLGMYLCRGWQKKALDTSGDRR